MYGDISRFTHAPGKHFSRVVYQQGRVFLDADPNEQTEILLRLQRDFIKDLVGPHAGPKGALGFEITKDHDDDLKIGPGRYYVDGILCQAAPPDGDGNLTYNNQPHPDFDPDSADDSLPSEPYLVYLDVWERHVSALEDVAVREAALGGADTAARTQVVWQVRVGSSDEFTGNPNPTAEDIREAAELRTFSERGRLRAQAHPGEPEKSPCIAAPTALYRGPENQLYRVEIQKVGKNHTPTRYKWSRDNGSVVFSIRAVAGNEVRLWSLGRDHTRTLEPGDLVEVVDDDSVLSGQPRALARVETVDRDEMRITLNEPPKDFSVKPLKHALLRRWDGHGNVETRGNANDKPRWLPLEDGVEVEFMPGGVWRAGDFWLIPARTATGQVEWPVAEEGPVEQYPLGIEHHYAPLAWVKDGDIDSLRTSFELPLTSPV